MKVFALIPSMDDATSFYRGMYPLVYLDKILPECQVTFAGKSILSHEIVSTDVIFLQRPYKEDHLKLASLGHKLRKTIWVDYDDDLFCLPESNPSYGIYKAAGKTIEQILSLADVVTTSTPALSQSLADRAAIKKLVTIPNAFNDYILEMPKEFQRKNLVMWRGTQSHQEDLLSFSAQIMDCANENHKTLFAFLGYNPWFIRGKYPNISHAEGVDILKYFDVIRGIKPSITIVTLRDTTFNRAKSNIAWIESTYAGGVVLAPDMPEWMRPGVMLYKNRIEFKEKLNQLIHMDTPDMGEMWSRARDAIDYGVRLSIVNEMRATIVRDLCNRS